jgi:hypothetical protein
MFPAAPFIICLACSLLALVMVAARGALPFVRKAWFVIAAGVGILFGGIGSGAGFRFVAETGIFDAGSYVDYSSNTIHAHWGYHPQAAASTFKWFYTYKYGNGKTKGPFQLPDAKVSDCAASYKMPIPEGEEWKTLTITCYADFVAPPVVTTNGVYHLPGVMRSINDVDSANPRYVTPGITIEIDGRVLTPTNNLSHLESTIDPKETEKKEK